jgi:hypothetical protein
VNRALGVVKFSEDLRVCDDGFLEIRFGWWYVLFVIAVCVPAEILSWTVLWSENVNRIVSHSTPNKLQVNTGSRACTHAPSCAL